MPSTGMALTYITPSSGRDQENEMLKNKYLNNFSKSQVTVAHSF